MFVCSQGGCIPACTWVGDVYPSVYLGQGVCIPACTWVGVWTGVVWTGGGVGRGVWKGVYVGWAEGAVGLRQRGCGWGVWAGVCGLGLYTFPSGTDTYAVGTHPNTLVSLMFAKKI